MEEKMITSEELSDEIEKREREALDWYYSYDMQMREIIEMKDRLLKLRRLEHEKPVEKGN